MLIYLRNFLLAIYGSIGILGWYNFIEKKESVDVQYDHFSPDITIRYSRLVLRFFSRELLRELKFILVNNEMTDKNKINILILNALQNNMGIIISQLNAVDTPIKNLGNWYADNFDFNNFQKEIITIIFDPTLKIDEKIQNISDALESYHLKIVSLLMNELRGNTTNGLGTARSSETRHVS